MRGFLSLPGPRRAVSLVEVLVATAVLAALAVPLVWNMATSKRRLHSTVKDSEAVVLASRLMGLLAKQPEERLPTVPAGTPSDLAGTEPGIYRSRWRSVYPGGGGRFVDLVELLGESDPEGFSSHVWIEDVAESRRGMGAVPAKLLVVSVTYQGSGPDLEVRRRFTLRSLAVRRVE